MLFKSTPKDSVARNSVSDAPTDLCQEENSDEQNSQSHQENKNNLNESTDDREPMEEDDVCSTRNEVTFVKEAEVADGKFVIYYVNLSLNLSLNGHLVCFSIIYFLVYTVLVRKKIVCMCLKSHMLAY